MARESIIIVGAGVGGLSAGCFAQMSGYHTQIFERHEAPGGVCAAWKRGGYVFDGCIHNLAGTALDTRLHDLWRELGVFPARPTYAFSELVRVERPGGEPFILYSNLDRLSRHMHQLFPKDAKAIDELVAAARALLPFDIVGLAAADIGSRLKALAAIPPLARFGPITLERFAERFTDPFLRAAFPTLIYDWPDQSVAMLLVFLAGAHKGDLGWPIGGSGPFVRAIEHRFLQLGGKVRYDTNVEAILVKDGRAIGVRQDDGSEHHADIVISNAYGPSTIFDMLGGKFASRAIRSRYAAPLDRIEMGLQVSLGINRRFEAEPHALVLPLDPPAVIAGEVRQRLYVESFGFDQSMAPHGKSVVKVCYGTSYSYWEDLYRRPELYRQEKQRIIDATIGLLERRFPGLRTQVEMSDLATPMSTRRYTGNRQGFRLTATQMLLGLATGRRFSQTLPGLKDFYMVGQWAGLPGLPYVAAMGRDVARAVCRDDGRLFSTVDPDGGETGAV
jgi:phytoene dehydrogenase-like protein